VAHLSLRGIDRKMSLKPGVEECTFRDVPLFPGPDRLEAWVEGNRNSAGVLDVTISRTDVAP
jgi:hypothetical protein